MIEHMQNRPIDITVIWSFVYLFFPLYELIYVSMEMSLEMSVLYPSVNI